MADDGAVDPAMLAELEKMLAAPLDVPASMNLPDQSMSLPPGLDMGGGGQAASSAAVVPPRVVPAKAVPAVEAPASGSAAPWPSWQDARGQFDDEGKVEVEQADPTAQILAAQSWEELNLSKEVLDGIREMGYLKPSKIQAWALPISQKSGNIIGQAQNGSGKTAAFSLSILSKIDTHSWYPQAVCVCPTRELATQNYEVIKKLGKHTGAGLFLAVPQEERAPRKVQDHIIVGTPGKLQDLLRKRVIDGRWISMLVIDEADVLIDENNNMGPQIKGIRAQLPQELQVLLFSATWPDHVQLFAKSMVPYPNMIVVRKEELALSTIRQMFTKVDDESEKTRVLATLYESLASTGQSMIFTNTKKKAIELFKELTEMGHAASVICTDNDVPDLVHRDMIMHMFRSGTTKVLISTDVLSRGIDIPAVTAVVNYDMPIWGGQGEANYETYVHRIGRTGRFGLKGIAVNLVTSSEMHLLDGIKRYFSCNIEPLRIEDMPRMLQALR